MARKPVKTSLTKKNSTKQTKQKTNTPFFTQIETMEKAFRDAPAKLAMQCRKDLSTLKQQEQKLKKTLKKTLDQKKMTLKKLSVLTTKSKNKLTVTAKKQMMSLQKTMQNINKEATSFTTQLEQVKKHCITLAKKQQHFTAISKIIAQFGKETSKKQKEKNKTTTIKRKKPSTIQTMIKEITTSHSGMPTTTTHTTKEPVEIDS